MWKMIKVMRMANLIKFCMLHTQTYTYPSVRFFRKQLSKLCGIDVSSTAIAATQFNALLCFRSYTYLELPQNCFDKYIGSGFFRVFDFFLYKMCDAIFEKKFFKKIVFFTFCQWQNWNKKLFFATNFFFRNQFFYTELEIGFDLKMVLQTSKISTVYSLPPSECPTKFTFEPSWCFAIGSPTTSAILSSSSSIKQP